MAPLRGSSQRSGVRGQRPLRKPPPARYAVHLPQRGPLRYDPNDPGDALKACFGGLWVGFWG